MLLTPDGSEAKITDFGLACLLSSAAADSRAGACYNTPRVPAITRLECQSDKVQQRGQCGQQSHGREHHYGDQNHHLFGLYAEKFAAAPFEFTFADITFLQYPIHPIHERRSQAAAIALVRTVIHERVQRGERALAGCRGCHRHSCTRRVWMVLVVRADLARFMAIHERTQGRV